MSNLSHELVKGTLQPDGSLVLEGRVSLPPGPVQVCIVPSAPGEAQGVDFLIYLQQARARLEAVGHTFRSREEIDADLNELRSGDDRFDDPAGHPDSGSEARAGE